MESHRCIGLCHRISDGHTVHLCHMASADERHAQSPSPCCFLLETDVRHFSLAPRILSSLAWANLDRSIVVFAVLHITSLSDSTTSHNRGVAITYPTVYLQVELLYALVSCAIPALNRWLRKFDTSMGTTWATAVGSQQRSTDQETKKNSRQSYRLSAVNNPQSRSKDRRHIPLNGPSLTPGNNQYTASCERQTNPYAGSSNSQEGHSNRSMSSEDMIIRKDVGWQVRYEDSTGPDDHSV